MMHDFVWVKNYNNFNPLSLKEGKFELNLTSSTSLTCDNFYATFQPSYIFSVACLHLLFDFLESLGP